MIPDGNRSGRKRPGAMLVGVFGVIVHHDRSRMLAGLAAAGGRPIERISRELWASGFMAECVEGHHERPAMTERIAQACGRSLAWEELLGVWQASVQPDSFALAALRFWSLRLPTWIVANLDPLMEEALCRALPELPQLGSGLLTSWRLGARKESSEGLAGIMHRVGPLPADRILAIDADVAVLRRYRQSGIRALLCPDPDCLDTVIGTVDDRLRACRVCVDS